MEKPPLNLPLYEGVRGGLELEGGFCHLNDFEVLEGCVFDGEADKCSHLVPALQACSSRIDVEQAELFVVLDFEDVAVSADEELWRTRIELTSNAGVVVPGIAADMCHQDVCSLACPAKLFGEETAEVASVAITTDGPKGTKLLQPHSKLQRTNVACMPYLVARLEVFEIAVVPISMGVAKQSDAFHLSVFLWLEVSWGCWMGGFNFQL